ncbi:MAG: hypothetical protein G8345_14635 [Magnetococcales bacterium]|nr:metallophosphoesterase [Magnetococcales bacterium]NGZ28113.1 hypothetical protein [Magnetococcales bacterium]
MPHPITVIGRSLTLLALAVGFAAHSHAGKKDDPLYRWVQLVPNAKNDGTPDVMVKVIMDAKASCPSLYVDKKKAVDLAPAPRVKPAGFDEVQLCEVRIQNGDPLVRKFQEVALNDKGNHKLSMPDLSKGVPMSQFIAFGCTGCRQDGAQGKCDKSDWPYPEVLKNADKKTGKMPAVVAHLGDIRYADQKTVADAWTLSGKDNTLGWQEEFFKPADDLLKDNWWIVMRGNHEACMTDPSKEWNEQNIKDRGSAWFYFFDDQKNGCQQSINQGDVMPGYALDATIYSSPDKPQKVGARLVVMDTVRTGDERDKSPTTSKQLYAAQFDRVASQYASTLPKNHPIWLLTHIPMANISKDDIKDTVVIDAINASQLAKQINKSSLTVAAHIHEFQLVNANAGNPSSLRPLQYVVGNGGVILSGKKDYQTKCSSENVSWTPIGEQSKVTEPWLDQQRGNYGYFLASFDKDGNGTLDPQFYDLNSDKWNDDKTVTCQSSGKDGSVSCSYLPKFTTPPKCP